MNNTKHGRNEFKWVRNSLWFKDEYLLAVVPHETLKDMFWIKWPDGDKSEDFYNISRAKDNAVTYGVRKANRSIKKQPTEAADAFK